MTGQVRAHVVAARALMDRTPAACGEAGDLTRHVVALYHSLAGLVALLEQEEATTNREYLLEEREAYRIMGEDRMWGNDG